jgi:hypothetical protein
VKTRSLGSGGLLALEGGQKTLSNLSRGVKITATQPAKPVATETREAAPPMAPKPVANASALVVEKAVQITTRAK